MEGILELYMSCMAYGSYGYGKTQAKNGRKEGKTPDFGMWQIMAIFSALLTVCKVGP